jgi:hypothetical protein
MRIAGALMTVLLVTLCLSACKPPATAGVPVCVTSVDNVHQSKGKPTDMDVKARLTCQYASVEEAYMQVKIERQSGAKWLATSSAMLDDEQPTVDPCG